MATTIGRSERRSRAPWDRPDGWGLALSIAIPLVAVLAGNGILSLTGSEEDPAYQAVAWNPPGWMIGAIWTVIYPMWGAARWKVATKDDARASRSRWLVALIAWGLCYPVVVEFTGTLGSVIANGFSLLLAVFVAMRVRPVSAAAFWLVAPSLIWLSVANALGITALTQAN